MNCTYVLYPALHSGPVENCGMCTDNVNGISNSEFYKYLNTIFVLSVYKK